MNMKLQLLRGNGSSATTTLADGELFVDKTNNLLYAGNNKQSISAMSSKANFIGSSAGLATMFNIPTAESTGLNFEVTTSLDTGVLIEAKVIKPVSGTYTGEIVITDNIYINGNIARVTAIAADAFQNNTGITSIKLGNYIKNIPDSAFDSCTNLFSIDFGNGLKSIGNSAFINCTSLTTLFIPASVETIGEEAFCYCSNLSSIAFAKNSALVSIGDWAFGDTKIACLDLKNCTKLTTYSRGLMGGASYISTLRLPTSLTTIDPYSMYQVDRGLETIVIPEGVTEIKEYAFSDMFYVKALCLPSTLTNISGNPVFLDTGVLLLVVYNGTKAQWNSIAGHSYFERVNGDYRGVSCTDGLISPTH